MGLLHFLDWVLLNLEYNTKEIKFWNGINEFRGKVQIIGLPQATRQL
jgi:hypothetical protein